MLLLVIKYDNGENGDYCDNNDGDADDDDYYNYGGGGGGKDDDPDEDNNEDNGDKGNDRQILFDQNHEDFNNQTVVQVCTTFLQDQITRVMDFFFAWQNETLCQSYFFSLLLSGNHLLLVFRLSFSVHALFYDLQQCSVIMTRHFSCVLMYTPFSLFLFPKKRGKKYCLEFYEWLLLKIKVKQFRQNFSTSSITDGHIEAFLISQGMKLFFIIFIIS